MKEKIDLSIICCYNNNVQLEKCLMNSLKMQTVEAELILIDNTSKKFTSAAAALNYGARIATKKYLLFVHQDIEFLIENSLASIYQNMTSLNNCIIGAAGVIKGRKGIISSMKEGSNYQSIGDPIIEKPTAVFTLDECLIGCKKDDFLNFDENTCDNWHLYGVDLCLQAHLIGLGVVVIPCNICHHSSGNVNHDFFLTLRKLKRKYHKIYEKIETCCIGCYTSPLSIKGNIVLKEIKNKLR